MELSSKKEMDLPNSAEKQHRQGMGLFIDKNEFDTENIIYKKPLSFYTISKNMGIYYQSPNDSEERKIIIETPKMKCPFSVKEFVNKNGKKTYRMSLSFTTITNLYNETEIRNFYSLVRNTDKYNEEYIEQNKKKLGLPKKIEYKPTIQRLDDNFPHFMNVYLPHDEENGYLFSIYNEKSVKSNIDIIKKQCVVSAVLELTDLIFMNTYYRANWTVLQLRKFPNYSPIQEYFMARCVLCDRDDPNDLIYDEMVKEYHKKVSQRIPLMGLTPTSLAEGVPQRGLTPTSLAEGFPMPISELSRMQNQQFIPQNPMMQMMQMMMNTIPQWGLTPLSAMEYPQRGLAPSSGIEFSQRGLVPSSTTEYPQLSYTDAPMQRGNPPPPPIQKPIFQPPSQDELQAGMKKLKSVPLDEIKLPKGIGGIVLDNTPKKVKSDKKGEVNPTKVNPSAKEVAGTKKKK